MGIRCAILMIVWLVAVRTGAVPLIADRHFQDGAMVLYPVGGLDEGIIQYKAPYGTTWWRLAQWGSQQSIYGTDPIALSSGSLLWSNAFKSVAMGPLDSADGDLVLAVNSINEYDGTYRQPGESWPAFLISQRIGNPQGWFKAYAPNIADLHELIIDIDARLLYANHVYTAGYNASLHAAQFLIYFTVQNLKTNPKTADYGNYYWFGLRLYDDRESLPGLNVQHDVGTGKLIYNVGIAPFCDTGLQVGAWKRVTGDILPLIKSGLQEAWSRGYLTNSFNYADYKIGGMNMGWEVPGLSDVAMQVRNFDLQAYGLDFAKPYEFNLDGESDGWSFTNMVDQAQPGALGGRWVLSVPGSDPQLIGPAMRLRASRYPQVVVSMANAGNPVDGSVAQLYWKRLGDADFTEDRSVQVSVGNGGGWKKYTFDTGSNTNWNGEIVQFRFDPVLYGDGHSVGVDYIRPVADTVIEGNEPALHLDVSEGLDRTVFYWDGVPYQQYTLQRSTNLVANAWTDVAHAVDLPFSNSLMEQMPSETNQPSCAYYHLLVSPGP